MKKIVFVNLITTIRLIGIFFIFPIYFHFGSFATGIYLIFIYLTDKIDGSFAKLLDSRTFFGSIYDGVCDKILNVVVFLVLTKITYLAFIPLVFEVLIFIINLLRFKFNQNMKTQEIGRFKMVILSITVVLAFLLSNEFTNVYQYALLFSTLFIFDLLTLFYYIKLFIVNEKKLQKKLIKNRNNLKFKLFDTKFYKKNIDLSYAEALKK